MLKVVLSDNGIAWEDFLKNRPEATSFQRFAWSEALQKAAGHKPYFLQAEEAGEIVGVLPLSLVEGKLFGKYLVSLPHYLGGICVASEASAEALIERACELADELQVNALELRGNAPQPAAEKRGMFLDEHKASFLVDLTHGEEALWKNLRKQNRNRIRKGHQADLTVESGPHLLEDFWRIFSLNTRAIGSLTFSRRFFGALLETFGDEAQLLAARQQGNIVAAKLVLGFRDTLTMLWGGTRPKLKAEGVNYFLTWETLRYALAKGYDILDMGRSTIGSGPYNFKAHWGGEELKHHWYIYARQGSPEAMRAESARFRMARRLWRNLPLPLTRALGPWIARQIP
jgi:FemAB-related protein (PEP-CTERM system-associated)